MELEFWQSWVQGCQIRALLDWHQNPGSLFDVRMCRSPEIAINLGGSKEVKIKINSIGTRILEVCERSESDPDQ